LLLSHPGLLGDGVDAANAYSTRPDWLVDQREKPVRERLGIAGSGAIACGLAATAARHADVTLWARSDDGQARARASVDKVCGRLSGEVNSQRVQVVGDLDAFADATFVVEAIVEEHDAKAALLERLGAAIADDAILGTTTSSLSVRDLAAASGRPERFVGLHVFNPVPRMKLVELVFPDEATPDTRTRSVELCEALGKTGVEVPDVPGFVVNRLLFPYLFSAARLQEETGLAAEAIDECMQLGAGHPMGPLALLDLVGLDVSKAIGETIGAEIPASLDALLAEGALGRKTGRGYHSYA
jgi:3-hydroxybutyryl-CoA dehydrogenase